MDVLVALAPVVFAGIGAWADPPPNPNVVNVCLKPAAVAEPLVVMQAKQTARGMFAEIGVKIVWREDRRYCKDPPDALTITLSAGTPDTEFPSALAYCRPYGGSVIEVFYDRVIRTVETRRVPVLLAHVFVHEIAHMLEGVIRHSETGVMKARWASIDYLKMTWRPLPFAPEDVRYIRRGMELRALRLAKKD
jgi:hypothetical protein